MCTLKVLNNENQPKTHDALCFHYVIRPVASAFLFRRKGICAIIVNIWKRWKNKSYIGYEQEI